MMSFDGSDCAPSVYFYIGANDSEEEDEGFENDCNLYSASRIPLFTQPWDNITTWEEGQDLPLELAMELLRILKGLKISPQENKQSFVYDAYMNRRVAKVSVALQKYKEHLCTQVFSTLEECEQQELSTLKKEIQQMKNQIQHVKLMSYQKGHSIQKQSLIRNIKEALSGSHKLNSDLDLHKEDVCVFLAKDKVLDKKDPSNREDESIVKCFQFRKMTRRK